MIKYILIFCLTVPVANVWSHPGVGIVMDSKGVVYYTDLQHIWKIGTDGKVRIAVRNVHSHELFLDRNDNLYGEHLWYEGEATDKWGHFVWKLAPDGAFQKIIDDREGFLTDYSFVRDGKDNMYLADRTKPCQQVLKKNKNGTHRHSGSCLKNIRWMTSTPEGILYVVDDGALKRIHEDGTVEAISPDLKERKLTQSAVNDQHMVMGIWTDSKGNVYTAVFGARKVKKIDGGRNVATVAETSIGWSPAGGLTSDNGDFWLLEYSQANKARVERITKDGIRTIYMAPE
ncbi:MAG TPA: hypothetical protein VEB86_16640 [Chryseosolibacter sp.]|nr:hypothetical protein [Chryseosolibacter sp.]